MAERKSTLMAALYLSILLLNKIHVSVISAR